MSLVLKTSSVRVATRYGDRIYRSIDEMPPELEKELRRCLESSRTETILIANQEAYDCIARGAKELPAEMQRLQPWLLRSRRTPAEPRVSGRTLFLIGFGLIFLFWAFWLWLIQTGTS